MKIGYSKHLHKKENITHNYIYSWSTYKSYLKHSCYFVKWCKLNYKCKTLDDWKPYINDLHLQHNKDIGTLEKNFNNKIGFFKKLIVVLLS